MRFQLLVFVIAILSNTATADSEAIDTDSKTGVQKSLRTQTLAEDEERSAYETVQVALHKLKFPVWLAKGREPAYVATKLKMTFPYVDDPMWGVYKSYKQAFDKRQNILHPAGL
ncbi:hypothetical protein P3T76_009901 [Phytophthora citrophthora]|uniref:RxLR effector protein n=1 Tax=Phytophthora citrophthora TaxID=4793 RepID=A0AAD9GEX5_9STRA|nr:hypothetical protein P3T76_009901 [Phytophthora citrophthora]